MSSSNPLQIYLLGPPAIQWHDEAIGISRLQNRALFYRLAATKEPTTRDHLCFLFWPDKSDRAARRYLSDSLSQLKKNLPDPDLIIVEQEQLSLNEEMLWRDTTALGQLYQTLQVNGGSPQDAAAIDPKQAREILTLYRGPFLDGFALPQKAEFEIWVNQQRQKWENRYLDTLVFLIDEETGDEHFERAIDHARQYLLVDELAEDIHRNLMSLYALSGNRSAALQQYDTCMVALERELGVEPLDSTRAIYQSILTGQVSARSSGDVPQTLWPRRLGTERLQGLEAAQPNPIPFIGRAAELGMLQQAYLGAQAGDGMISLIIGEPGIGKTRLADEFAQRMPEAARLLQAKGYLGMVNPPYQALIDALQPILAAQSDVTLLDQIEAEWLAEATRILPDLHQRFPQLQPQSTADTSEALLRLYEAIFQILSGLTTDDEPLVLYLDNLNWMDSATLNWLSFMGRKVAQENLLLLLTHQEIGNGFDQAVNGMHIDGLRQSLPQSAAFAELSLGGLESAEIETLLLTRLYGSTKNGPTTNDLEKNGAAKNSTAENTPSSGAVVQPLGTSPAKNKIDQALLEQLQKTTDGNPLFLNEIATSLIESQWDPTQPIDWDSVANASNIYMSIEQRLQNLSPVARQLLDAGAVLGSYFDFDTLLHTAGRTDLETVDGLLELINHQLLLDLSDERFQFRHEIIQLTVYHNLNPWRRRVLEKRSQDGS